jgi:hypothetical protein
MIMSRISALLLALVCCIVSSTVTLAADQSAPQQTWAADVLSRPATSGDFVLYSNQNKPPEIVGNIIYADNTLAANITNGTYSVVNRSGGGNDGNAYKTIQEAIFVMSAGDVLLMRGGTFHEYNVRLQNIAGTWLHGTPDRLFTMQSYPGEWAIISADHRETTNGDGTLNGYPVIYSKGIGDNYTRYWRFAYFEVTGGGPALVNPTTGVTRTYTDIQNATGKGFDLWPGQYLTFDHMRIHENHGGGGPNGGAGISIVNGADAGGANHILVTHCYLYDNGWPGTANENLSNIVFYCDYNYHAPWLVVLSKALSFNEVRYSLIEDSHTGVKVKGAQWLSIGDSTDYNSGTNMTAKAYGDKIHNNIFRNCGRATLAAQDFVQIYNNIVESCPGGIMVGNAPSNGCRDHFYACIYNNSIRNSTAAIGFTLWKGITADPGNYLTGPVHPHLSAYNNILLCGKAVDDIYLPINICPFYNGDTESQTMDMSTIDVNDNLLTGRAANTGSVRQLKVSSSTTGWLAKLPGTEMWNVPDSTLVFAGTVGIDRFYINKDYQLPNGDTLATAGRGGAHPYLDGVFIPNYLGAVDPSDTAWPDEVQSLTGLGTTIKGVAAFIPEPLAPLNLSATAGPGQINLAWSDTATNESGYIVQRKTGAGGTWATLTTLAANTTTYGDTSASAGTTYYYRVAANNSAGDSAYSNEASASLPASSITITNPHGGEVWVIGQPTTVAWTSAGSVGNVDIDLSTDSGATWTTLLANTANDGSESVVVPNGFSTQCKVRVKQNAGGNPSDTSDANFATTVAGDITLDGYVDGGDLNILLSNWNAGNAIWATGDLTGDGFVDGGDLNILLSNWNSQASQLAGNATNSETIATSASAQSVETSVSASVVQNANLSIQINYQPASVVAPQGYLVDSGLPFSVVGTGYSYGWTTDMSSFAVQRNNAASLDVRYDTAVMLVNGGTWEMSVPNGMYDVKIVSGAGDSSSLSAQKFTVEGVPATQTQSQAQAQSQSNITAGWSEETVTVVVTDGKLTIVGNPGSSLCFVQITGR